MSHKAPPSPLTVGDRLTVIGLGFGILSAVLVSYMATRDDVTVLKTEMRHVNEQLDRVEGRMHAMEIAR